MRPAAAIWVASLLLAVAAHAAKDPAKIVIDPAEERQWLAGFNDGNQHWRKQHDQEDVETYDPTEVREIADNVLLYQRDCGGWPPNEEMTRILTKEEKEELLQEKAKVDTSLDNRATYSQVRYLGHAYELFGDEKYREACERGLAFLLSAQLQSGGWPHTYPAPRADYHSRITFADDVMVGVLGTLREAAEGRTPFTFLDQDLRIGCFDAHERGLALILNLQVRRGDVLTGWAGQYDEKTRAPAPGRSFEPTALVGQESVQVIRYLMSLPDPDERVRAAVIAGVQWLESSQVTGKRLKRVEAPLVRFDHHTSRFDVILIDDGTAPPLWARFYDIDTNEPILTDRDGVRVKTLAELSRERRTGYSWFGPYAAELLAKEYPAWHRRHALQDP